MIGRLIGWGITAIGAAIVLALAAVISIGILTFGWKTSLSMLANVLSNTPSITVGATGSVQLLDAADNAKRQKELAAKAERDRIAEATAAKLAEDQKFQARTGRGDDWDIFQVFVFDKTNPATTIAATVIYQPVGGAAPTVHNVPASGASTLANVPPITHRIIVQVGGRQQIRDVAHTGGLIVEKFRF